MPAPGDDGAVVPAAIEQGLRIFTSRGGIMDHRAAFLPSGCCGTPAGIGGMPAKRRLGEATSPHSASAGPPGPRRRVRMDSRVD